MILAGEPSGDLHGANLVKSLKQVEPELKISGIGGDGMAAQGMELFFHISQLSVMGLTEVLLQFRVIKHAFDLFRKQVRTTTPDLVILIDYPGFNLRAAAFAKKIGVPVLYYITPKVWAWKRSRLKTIKRVVDHAALIFPFEAPMFRKEGIPSTFVGHPLLDCYPDTITPYRSREDGEFIIGLLPGSRETEISALFKTMVESAVIIREQMGNVRFLVSAAPSVDHQRMEQVMAPYNKDDLFTLVKGTPQAIFHRADLLVAASGTVTLEAAICGVPMIIVYKLSSLTFFIGRIFVRLKHVGLANIIAGHEVVPELLQNQATPENIAHTAVSLLNLKKLGQMRSRLLMIRKLLGGRGASLRTARLALDLMRTRSL
jgi:lipid-A-disaccharide synthase